MDASDDLHSSARSRLEPVACVRRRPAHNQLQHAHLVSSRRKARLVDCVSFEAMRRMGLTNTFCFDPHFAEQGFRIVTEEAGLQHESEPASEG